MTLTELTAQFSNVENGIIRNPGKFEGEPLYVYYYWDIALNGFSDSEEYDDDDTNISVFSINTEDIDMFPSLAGSKEIRVWESDRGFVYHELS